MESYVTVLMVVVARARVHLVKVLVCISLVNTERSVELIELGQALRSSRIHFWLFEASIMNPFDNFN